MKTLPYNSLMTSLMLMVLALCFLMIGGIGLGQFPSLSQLLLRLGLIGVALASLSGSLCLVLAKLGGIKVRTSFWLTWRMRHFCKFQALDTKSPMVISQQTPSAKVIHQANLSLLTLTVTLTNQTGKLLWYLPLAHEAQEKLVELFPKVKIELNHHAEGYLFNDITRLKGNLYHAQGYQR